MRIDGWRLTAYKRGDVVQPLSPTGRDHSTRLTAGPLGVAQPLMSTASLLHRSIAMIAFGRWRSR